MASQPTTTTTTSQQVDESARRQFEADRQAGRREPIEHFLPAEDARHYLATLEELVHIDLEYAWKAPSGVQTDVDGSSPLVETYLRRFPRLNQPEIVLRLLQDEYQLRQRFGDHPSTAEYQARFPDLVRNGQEVVSTLASVSTTVTRPFPQVPGYEVLRLLGRGGMGVVYEARQLSLHRTVALKTILAGAGASPVDLVRFRTEAEAVARLQHPHIVQIHEIGEHDGCPYFSMEFVEGGSLAQRLNNKPVPAERAARLAEILARAIHYCHQCGIIHRDLKPANILLSSKFKIHSSKSEAPATNVEPGTLNFELGGPKITDFGLAKQLQADSGQTRSGDVIGTPSYMAPEQAAGQVREIGPLTDVYALGAILYELLAGRPPFRGATILETLAQVRSAEPVPPSRLRAHVPRDLETICLKCLRKEPGNRYAGALELADDLGRFLAHEPIRAQRAGWAGRLVRWCRRNPALAATITLAALIIGAVAGVGFWQVTEERDSYRRERDHANEERTRAETNLYRALVGEAQAQMQARGTGWWWQALDNLEKAAHLDVPGHDPTRLRELAIECMGTDHPCMRLSADWPGHSAPVSAVAFSPDGKLVASGSHDRSVRLWSGASGQCLAVLAGHARPVSGVRFHPDGRHLASGSWDGTVRLWDIAAAPKVPSPRVFHFQGGPVLAVEMSTDGTFLAAGFQKVIQVVPLQDPPPHATSMVGSRVLTGHLGAVTCLAVRPRHNQLASGSADKTVRLWDLATGKPAASWSVPNVPNTLAFHPTQPLLAWADTETFGFKVKNFQFGIVQSFPQVHAGIVHSVGYDPKGQLLTASGDGSLKLWPFNISDRYREPALARAEFGSILSAAVSPDGRWIVAGYQDAHVRLWELYEPDQRALLWSMSQNAAFIGREHRLVSSAVCDLAQGTHSPTKSFSPEPVVALTVHPGGRRFAFARSDGTLCIWDLLERKEAARWKAHSRRPSLATSPDGKHLASVSPDGKLKVWDWKDGRLVREFDPKAGALHRVAWDRDGRKLAFSGDRGTGLWEPDGDTAPKRLTDLSLLNSAVAFGQDCLALCGPNGTIEIRDGPTGRHRHTLPGHPGGILALEFSADGRRLASSGADAAVRLWDPATGKEIMAFKHPGLLPSWLAFDPKGRYLASQVAGARILDLRAGTAAADLFGSVDDCGQFLPDGSALILGTRVGAVRLCTLPEIEQARALAKGSSGPVRVDPLTMVVPGGHLDTIWGVAASPDGRWVATASHDRTVKLWDARTLRLVRTIQGYPSPVWCVAFSPDSKYLASGSTGSGGGLVKVWDLAGDRFCHQFEGHSRLVLGLAFHPRRPWLASSSLDGSIHLWDLAAGKPRGLVHRFDQPIYSIAFQPGGRWLAAACQDHRVALWALDRLSSLPAVPSRFLTGHRNGVWSVGFSSDGRYLASGSEQGVIILWDGETFARVVTLRGSTGQIRGICFSQDGQLLAGAAYVKPAIVWDLARVRRDLKKMHLDW